MMKDRAYEKQENNTKLLRRDSDGYDFINGKVIGSLNHEKRMEFGRLYAERLRETHGENLLFFGISGSTATHQARLNSDIDGLVITEKKENWPKSKWLHQMFNGIEVSIAFYTLEEAEDIISSPNTMWPYRVKRIMTSTPFYQKFDIKDRFQKLLEEGIDEEMVNNAVSKQLIIAFSSLGKIIFNAEKDELANTRSAATETFAEYLDATVALLNKGQLEDDYGFRNILHIAKFKDIPSDYVKLSTIIWKSNDPIEIKNAAISLLRNTAELAKRHGVEIKNHTSVESLAVK